MYNLLIWFNLLKDMANSTVVNLFLEKPLYFYCIYY